MEKKMDQQARRRAILEAAVWVFAEKGMLAAKIEDIAERAGVAKGTVYLYFKSKAEIFEAIFGSHKAMMAQGVKEMAESNKEPFAVVEDLIRKSVHSAEHAATPPQMMLDIWGAMCRKDEGFDLRDEFKAMLDLIKRGLGETPKSRGLSQVVLAFLLGEFLTQMLGIEENRQETADAFISLLQKAVHQP